MDEDARAFCGKGARARRAYRPGRAGDEHTLVV
jgi:hypothetical protein